MKSWLVAVAASPLLCACHGGSGSGTEVPGIAGPCVVTVEEPIISIDMVTAGGIALETIVLSNLVIDGVRQDLRQEVEPGWINIEADPTEDTLLCTLPCSFSEIEGQYSFTVSAEGFGSAPVSVDAVYEAFDGGCPATYSGGVHLELNLPSAQRVSQEPPPRADCQQSKTERFAVLAPALQACRRDGQRLTIPPAG